MPSISGPQRKRDELQTQYDLLSDKIKDLRVAHAIEAGAAARFQLGKQIEQAEAERDAIEQQIKASSAPEQLVSEGGHLPGYAGRRVPGSVIYALQVVGTLVTLVELLGVASKGLRFLGGFATHPAAVLIAVVALTALIGCSCGYVLLKKQKNAHPWWKRLPVYGARDRTIARLILVANTTVTLILILGVLRYDVVHAQPMAEGQLGVAVAQFGDGIEMQASARARELSAFVARNLRREIDLLPGLAGNVTVISGPLVKSEEEAQKVAEENGVALVIWGWVSGNDTFVPSFTFVGPPGTEVGLKEIPGWYEVEISGGGTLELGQTVARRISGLIEYIVGLIYLNQSDYDQAVAEFQRAIALTEGMLEGPVADHEMRTMNRTLAIYHLVLGRTCAAQGKPDQARAEYEAAMGHDREYGPLYVGFGNIDYSEGRCGEALQWYEKAVELVPRTKRASALYARGNAHFCLGQYEAAAADYARAIEGAEPGDKSLSLYYLVLGITLCRLNRFSEGIEEIRQAYELAEPDTSLQEAATKESENCRARAMITAPTPQETLFPTVTPTPTPALFPTTPLTPTLTLFPTRLPTSAPTPTLFPTPIPGATVPEPVAPAQGLEYRSPLTFQWRGFLRAGQAYQVTARHTESGYVVQSELLTDQSWVADLPAARFGEWRWTVSVVQSGRTLATSSEWMLWFNPFSRSTPFPTLQPTCFPTSFPTPPPPTQFPTSPPRPTPTWSLSQVLSCPTQPACLQCLLGVRHERSAVA